MALAILAFLSSTLAALASTPLARDVGLRIGVLDRPMSGRKIHVEPTPRTGGLAIVAAFLLALGLVALLAGAAVGTRQEARLAAGLVLGGLCVAAIGLVDDVRGLRPGWKFLFQVAAALVAWGTGHRIELLHLPFGGDLVLGALSLPVTLLWIVGLVNALNLVDGLDGLAAGIAFLVLAALGGIAGGTGDTSALVVCATLAGAVLGFLRHNLHPATIFMGDAGSMFLGFVLALTGLRVGGGGPGGVSLIAPAVALALPLGDTLLAMARRALRGAPLSRADRGHVHHRLLAVGLTHPRAVLALHAAGAILAAAAVVVAFAPPAVTAATLAALSAGAALALRRLGFIRRERATDLLRQRRRNLALRAAVRDLAVRLRRASDPEAVLEAVMRLTTALGGRAVAIRLGTPGPPLAQVRTLERGFAGAVLWRTHHDLEPGRGPAALEIGWPEGPRALDRDLEIAIERACELVTDAFRRQARPGRAPRWRRGRALDPATGSRTPALGFLRVPR